MRSYARRLFLRFPAKAFLFISGVRTPETTTTTTTARGAGLLNVDTLEGNFFTAFFSSFLSLILLLMKTPDAGTCVRRHVRQESVKCTHAHELSSVCTPGRNLCTGGFPRDFLLIWRIREQTVSTPQHFASGLCQRTQTRRGPCAADEKQRERRRQTGEDA